MDEPSRVMVTWATVSLFYSGVHLVNAYLWETAHITPSSHAEREQIMRQWPTLSPVYNDYIKFNDYSGRARHTPGYSVSITEINRLRDVYLERVKNAVASALLPSI